MLCSNDLNRPLELSSDKLFESKCETYIRLCIVNSYDPNWKLYHFNDIFITEKGTSISLYKSSQDVINEFDCLKQIQIPIEDLIYGNIKEYLFNGFYILGLCDTFYFKLNKNYKTNHSKSLFLIYGTKHNSYKVFISHAEKGYFPSLLTNKELKKMFSYENIDSNLLNMGLPLSAIKYTKTNNHKATIINYINKFYTQKKYCFLDDIISLHLRPLVYSVFFKDNYSAVSNFKILTDFFKLLSMKSLYVFADDRLASLYDDINRLLIANQNIFARYLYTGKAEYLNDIVNNFYELKKRINSISKIICFF